MKEARLTRQAWTEEEWGRALELNGAGATPQAIAMALKRPAQSVYSKFSAKCVRLNLSPPFKRGGSKAPRVKTFKPGEPWPRDMWLRALAMADAKNTSDHIAEAFGEMVSSHDVRMEFARQGKSRQLPDSPVSVDLSTMQNRLEEAARYRDALNRRDLTATFFGDPPPGFSALDRQRAAEAIR